MFSDHPATQLKLWDIVDDTVVTTHGCYVRGLQLRGLDSQHIAGELLLQSAAALYESFKCDYPDYTSLQLLLCSHTNYEDVFERHARSAPADPLLARQRQRRVEFLRNSGLRRHSLYAFIGSARGMGRRQFANVSQREHSVRMSEAIGLQARLQKTLQSAGVGSSLLPERTVMELLYQGLNPGSQRVGDLMASEDAKEEDPRSNPVHLPGVSLRDQLLHSEMEWADSYVQVGSTYQKVLTLKQLPQRTRFTLPEVFARIDADYRLSVNILFPNQAKMQRAFERQRRFTHATARGSQFVEDNAGLAKYGDATELSKTLADTGQKLVLFGAQAVLGAQSLHLLRKHTKTFEDRTKDIGLTWFEETRAHDRELFKTLPAMGMGFDRHKVVTSNNAVDLMPLCNIDEGDREPVLLLHGMHNRLYSYNPIERARDNWNAAVFGASGSGKSVVMNMLIASAMLGNHETRGRVMVVDFAGETKSSYLMASRLFGGEFVPILGRGASLNPFPTPSVALGEDGQLRKPVFNFLSVLTDVLLCNSAEDKEAALLRAVLQRAIIDTYRKVLDRAPLYEDMLEVLRGYLETHRKEIDPDRTDLLVQLLEGFLGGPNAHLFNTPTRVTTTSPFVIFDLHGVDLLPANIQEAITYSVCHAVKCLAFDEHDDRMKYVVMDEVAKLVRHRRMGDLFTELYDTARKHNTSVWTVTQKYSDYIKSALAETVQVNSTSLILLNHADQAEKVRKLIIEDWDLNGREARIFRDLKTVKGEYSEMLLRTELWDAEASKRAVRAKLTLRLSPLDYQIATSDALDRARQRRFIEANPQTPLAKVLDHIAYRARGAA